LEAEKPGKGGFIELPYVRRILNVSVSRGQENRPLRFMDAMVKALEHRGATFVRLEQKDTELMGLRIGGEPVVFELSELLERREGDSWIWWWERWNCAVSGRLQFRILATEPKGARRSWSDCTRYQLEHKVGEIIHWIFVTAESTKRARLAQEERGRQREAEQKRKEEERRRKEDARRREEQKLRIEERNRERLEESARAWVEARRLRRFIRACEMSFRRDDEPLPARGWQRRWLDWVRKHTDRLDPKRTTVGVPL
jgi:hypothetical protein